MNLDFIPVALLVVSLLTEALKMKEPKTLTRVLGVLVREPRAPHVALPLSGELSTCWIASGSQSLHP